MAAPLILIVEDDDQVRSTIGQWIEHYGYRVSLASELSAAERVLRETRPALLIVDVSLPGGTGLRLVELARPRGIPVLLISGEPTNIQRLEGGPFPFLHKPFRLTDLEREVKRLLAEVSV